jgi:hypothetical protein
VPGAPCIQNKDQQPPPAPLFSSAPSLSKQKRMSSTSRWRCADRKRPMTMPLHVVICWSRVYTRLDSGWNVYDAVKPVSRPEGARCTVGLMRMTSISWSTPMCSMTSRL